MLDFDTVDVTPDWQHARDRAKHQTYYHSDHYKRPESSHRKERMRLLDRPVCSLDGEGGNDLTGKHHYKEFRAVAPEWRGEILSESLTTFQCLDFILSLPENHTNVIYGGSYDTNMWLRDLPHKQIDRLLDKGIVYFGPYRIHWVERKIFTVSKGNVSRTVYDVLANFQRKFADVCEAWGVGLEHLEFIRFMKDQRDHLSELPPEDVARYNWLECEMLGELCRRFFAAIKATGYKPQGVYGPGALASAAMTKHGVKQYMPIDTPAHMQDIFLRAYKGGRFDTSMLGEFSNVWQADIKSAYPDQIRDLPCLRHAEWVPWNGEPLERFSVYHVEWDVPHDTPWPPFPWRAPDGTVFYPSNGAGWFYGDEVSAAIELFPTGITVIDGYRLIRHCSHQPFHYIEPLYKLRQSMPYEQGTVIKLVLNSTYGKTAQQVGGRNGKPPPFQCFPWAGMITSGTRAKLLRGMVGDPKTVIGIATDSLVMRRKLDLPVSENLGDWEVKRLAKYAQIGNGLYHGTDAKGKAVERSRGLERSTIDWDACMAAYRESRGMGLYRFTAKTRFITLREARMRVGESRDYYACRWVTEPRQVSFMPSRRWWGDWNRNRRICEPYSYSDLRDRSGGKWDSRESSPFRVKTDSAEVNDRRERFHPGVTEV